MSSARHGSVVALICAALLAGCGGGARVHISVDHPTALWDVPLTVTISGLRAHEHALLRARAADVHGKTYVSETSIRADGRGRVVLRGDTAMRVLWSIAPAVGGDQTYGYAPPADGERLTLSVAGASTTVTRLVVAPGVHVRRLRPASVGFYGEFFTPPSTSVRRPGILVFGGSEGGLYTTPEAALYASHGYPTLALAYFGEPGLPRNLVRIPLEYFAKALRWLGSRQGVDRQKLVVEGISRGSEVAQLLGVHYPRLVHAVVAMVPGVGSACGITRFTGSVTPVRCLGPAWTFRGRPVPYVPFGGPANPYPFADERIDGPVFLDCGGYDQLWESCPMARAIVARLLAHHFRHRVTFVYYPRAGHGVGSLLPYAPGTLSFLTGATPDANQYADANGWPRLLTFLQQLADS